MGKRVLAVLAVAVIGLACAAPADPPDQAGKSLTSGAERSGQAAGSETRVAAASTAPAWRGTSQRLPQRVRERMRGSSWRRGCPVHLNDLRLLKVRHWGYDGEVHAGWMVVHRDAATPMLRTLKSIYDNRFPIRRMRLVDAYGADDDRSMAANNTSAFNCRKVSGTTRWSVHAYGRAVDINPIQNPWVKGSAVEPPAGRKYLDRSRYRKGMIMRGGVVTKAFNRIGWGWGGNWTSSKDYQHFSSNGR